MSDEWSSEFSGAGGGWFVLADGVPVHVVFPLYGASDGIGEAIAQALIYENKGARCEVVYGTVAMETKGFGTNPRNWPMDRLLVYQSWMLEWTAFHLIEPNEQTEQLVRREASDDVYELTGAFTVLTGESYEVIE